MEEILLYSTIALWVSVLFIFTCLFFVFRQFGEVYLKSSEAITRDGVSIGKQIPKFKSISFIDNLAVTNSIIDKPTLMVFISPNCQACKDLLKVWNKAKLQYPTIDFLLVGHGTREEFEKMFKKQKAEYDLLIDEDGTMVNRFRVRVSPFAFIIDEKGEVKSKGVCNGLEHIDHYLTSLEDNLAKTS
jgi:methylamine dehydrogenase accessory protein MauD